MKMCAIAILLAILPITPAKAGLLDGIIGGVIGGVIGGELNRPRDPPPRYDPYYYPRDPVEYCLRRFRTYNPETGYYYGYDRRWHPCP